MQGKTVRLRDKTELDGLREYQWSLDPEIRALNPVVDCMTSAVAFTVETLSGEHIGSCGAYSGTLREAQVGIAIGDKSFWGKGYGTEAMNLLVDYCFHVLGLQRVYLKVLETNTRAQRSYKKCGFVRYGKLCMKGYDFVLMEKIKEAGYHEHD